MRRHRTVQPAARGFPIRVATCSGEREPRPGTGSGWQSFKVFPRA